MKYLLFASLIFVLSTLCTQAKKIDTYIMDGGVEKTDPNGNTYCGFEWAVADYTTGVMECHGEGNIHCDDVQPSDGLHQLKNDLIGHAANSMLNNILSGNYNENMIINGTMYYGYTEWSVAECLC